MKYILMDLDGTITNPKLGITKSIQYALKACDIQVEDLDTMCKYIGPPLRNTFMDFYGFSKEKADFAIAKYREYYVKTGIYENEVYEGMEELLKKLKKEGMTIITATSKPEVYARKILEYYQLDQYFDDICGDTLDGCRYSKEIVIRYALEKNGVNDKQSIVMIGDRKYDIEGAKMVGIASVGVLFGYGSKEELEEAGADRLSETVEDIYSVVMSL